MNALVQLLPWKLDAIDIIVIRDVGGHRVVCSSVSVAMLLRVVGSDPGQPHRRARKRVSFAVAT